MVVVHGGDRDRSTQRHDERSRWPPRRWPSSVRPRILVFTSPHTWTPGEHSRARGSGPCGGDAVGGEDPPAMGVGERPRVPGREVLGVVLHDLAVDDGVTTSGTMSSESCWSRCNNGASVRAVTARRWPRSGSCSRYLALEGPVKGLKPARCERDQLDHDDLAAGCPQRVNRSGGSGRAVRARTPRSAMRSPGRQEPHRVALDRSIEGAMDEHDDVGVEIRK